jgi:ABC-type nickel/cobalt efflux system permease component RcnA
MAFHYALVQLLLATGAAALGHPLGPRTFDRAIQVVVFPERLEVIYELGIGELTLATELLALVEPGRAPADQRGAVELYRDQMAPILGRGLIVKVNQVEQPVALARTEYEIRDHARLTFVFRAPLPGGAAELSILVQETNFSGERGYLRMALKGRLGVEVLRSTRPAIVERLPLLASWEMTPEEEEASRFVRATLRRPIVSTGAADDGADSSAISPAANGADPASPDSTVAPNADESPAATEQDVRLRDLLHATGSSGVWWLALLSGAFVIGALHALKPGHGKTMVAAYLIGEQGNIWHAIVLGVVTTLTHTGSVLFVALILGSFAGTAWARAESLSFWLTLVSGILIAWLGLLLLIRRLRGRDDLLHVHGPGGHVHLPDGSIQWLDGSSPPQPHGHDQLCEPLANDHAGAWSAQHGRVPNRSLRVGGLVVLGVSGGLVPCDDAVLLLIAAIGAGLLTRAVYILLAFSAGLASVLVMIGVLVVKVKGFASRGRGAGLWAQRLSVVSACLITLIGVGLCIQAFVQG